MGGRAAWRSSLSRSARDALHRLIGEDHDAIWTDGCGVEEAERGGRSAISEQALAGAEHDWEDHQPVLVDELVLGQSPHELSTTSDEDVSCDLLLEPRNLTSKLLADHGRVVPLRVLVGERPRDDVLGHGVHLRAELAGAGHRRPSAGEARVGDPAQELRLGGHELVELELVTVLAAVE